MTEVVYNQQRKRSNSFQRMLELEKKLMYQRSHHSIPSTPSTADGSLPSSPGLQPRRFELIPKDGKKAPPPVRNYSAVPPPLFSSHSSHVRTESPRSLQRKPVGQGSAHHKSQTSPSTPSSDRPSHKTVAFVFPPELEDQRSVCQSPTWEAYDRRKKEKKEEKREEKREKELAIREAQAVKEQASREAQAAKEQAMQEAQAMRESLKDAPKPRGRRLSKPPPPPPAPTMLANQGRSMTEPPKAPKEKPRSRSSSFLGFSRSNSNKDDPDQPRRSRSSSLTSLFRNSFEIRRASFDETSSTGFLGGVKLQKKKQKFQQDVLEDQAKGDSKVHPALRKSFLGHGSFTPLKTGHTARDKEEDAKRRAYPPISINTAAARGHGAKTPQSPSRRNSINIYLWSARARRNSVSSDCAITDDTEDEKETAQRSDSVVLYNKAKGLNRRGGVHMKGDKGSPSGSIRQGNASSASISVYDDQGMEPVELPATPIDESNDTCKTTVSKPPIVQLPKPLFRRLSTSSTLSIPPEPPRKSSKRSSTVFSSRMQSPISPVDMPFAAIHGKLTILQQQQQQREEQAAEEKKLVHNNPPSIRYEHTLPGVRPKPITSESAPLTNTGTKWNLKGAAKSAFGRGHSSHASVSSTASAPNSTLCPLEHEPPMPKSKAARGRGVIEGLGVPVHSNEGRQSLESPTMLSPVTWRPTTSSSESSCYSDAIQSASLPSTPNTSPPQSDSGRFATVKPSGLRNGQHLESPYWSYANSPQLRATDTFEVSDMSCSEAEGDPIGAAAKKVMEAFSNANLRSPARKQTFDSSADSSMAPTPIIAPLRHRQRSKGQLHARETSTDGTPPVGRIHSPLVRHRPTLSDPEGSTKSLRHRGSLHQEQTGDAVAKVFVECCSCRYYLDMPSKLYETMSGSGGVACPWCKHEMSTKCCAGFAATVYVKERFH